MSHRRTSYVSTPPPPASSSSSSAPSALLARRGTAASQFGLGLLDLSHPSHPPPRWPHSNSPAGGSHNSPNLAGAKSPIPGSPATRPPLRAHRSSAFGLNEEDRRKGLVAAAEEGNVEPDELFRRMTVGEVKRVEGKLRSSAMSKQSELRNMVGERYRDLLSSSVALSTLFASSSRLSAGLKDMKVISSSVGDVDAAGGKGTSAQSDAGEDNIAQELSTLLPLASQTKLLLDAPETLWRFLESKQFLQAAWLFCLGRVVHQEVGENFDGNIQLPLLQRQWESLSQFRSQIVKRATMGLRELATSPSETSQTLISIILLDSIPLPSALSLLLAQRTRLLRDAIANSSIPIDASSSSTPQPARLLVNGNSSEVLSRSSSTAGARRATVKLDEAEVKKVLSELVGVLGGTVGLAREVFGSNGDLFGTTEEKSLIVWMMEGIESGEEEVVAPPSQRPSVTPLPTSTVDSVGSMPSFGSKEKTHLRRASRLASISAPFSLPSPSSLSAGGPATSFPSALQLPPIPIISTPGLLLTLPSSPLLLRYLPSSVKSYTPFLSSDSASSSLPLSALKTTLASWLTANTSFLRTSVEDLSSSLDSVRAVWEVRDEVRRVLLSVEGLEDDERVALGKVLEAGWEKRVKEIWDEKLGGLADRLGSSLKDKIGVIKLGVKESDGDIYPPKFLFSASLPFPSSSSSIPPSSSLPTFRAALRRRVAVRTPLLDSILRELESLAAQLKSDVDVLRRVSVVVEGEERSKLLDDYKPRAEKALQKLVWLLESELDAQKGSDDPAFAVNAEIFIGRVAIHLLASKTFQSDLLGEETILEPLRTDLIAIHARSLEHWRSQAVDQAIARISPMFDIDPIVLETSLSYLWKPSPSDSALLLPTLPSRSVLLALHSLVASIQALGCPPPASSTDPAELSNHGRDLYRAFESQVVELEGWASMKGKRSVQSLWDLRFLREVGGLFDGEKEEREEWKGIVDSVERLALTSIPTTSRSTLTSSLTSSITAELLRTQTILSPLLPPSSTTLSHTTPAISPSPSASALTRRQSNFDGGAGSKAEMDARHATLLRLGVPSAGGGELTSSLATVSPSQRFGLLSVAVSAR